MNSPCAPLGLPVDNALFCCWSLGSNNSACTPSKSPFEDDLALSTSQPILYLCVRVSEKKRGEEDYV